MDSNFTVVGSIIFTNCGTSFVNTNLAAAGGLSLLSSILPIQGGLQTDLGYVPQRNDTVYQWRTSVSPPTWVIHEYTVSRSGVGACSQSAGPAGPAEPTIAIGEGFWLCSGPGATWSNYYGICN